MFIVQRDPYPTRPLFHHAATREPVFAPNPWYHPGLHGLGLMIVQDDAGRTTGIIRKFESPYHAYRHYNPGFHGLGEMDTSTKMLIGCGVALCTLIFGLAVMEGAYGKR
ncbi:MAG: hypothetical protein WC683_02310 [bacterium]